MKHFFGWHWGLGELISLSLSHFIPSFRKLGVLQNGRKPYVLGFVLTGSQNIANSLIRLCQNYTIVGTDEFSNNRKIFVLTLS